MRHTLGTAYQVRSCFATGLRSGRGQVVMPYNWDEMTRHVQEDACYIIHAIDGRQEVLRIRPREPIFATLFDSLKYGDRVKVATA